MESRDRSLITTVGLKLKKSNFSIPEFLVNKNDFMHPKNPKQIRETRIPDKDVDSNIEQIIESINKEFIQDMEMTQVNEIYLRCQQQEKERREARSNSKGTDEKTSESKHDSNPQLIPPVLKSQHPVKVISPEISKININHTIQNFSLEKENCEMLVQYDLDSVISDQVKNELLSLHDNNEIMTVNKSDIGKINSPSKHFQLISEELHALEIALKKKRQHQDNGIKSQEEEARSKLKQHYDKMLANSMEVISSLESKHQMLLNLLTTTSKEKESMTEHIHCLESENQKLKNELFLKIEKCSMLGLEVEQLTYSNQELRNSLVNLSLKLFKIEEKNECRVLINNSESGLCSLCKDNKTNCIFLPCEHKVNCFECMTQFINKTRGRKSEVYTLKKAFLCEQCNVEVKKIIFTESKLI
jgi:hypothetical protein